MARHRGMKRHRGQNMIAPGLPLQTRRRLRLAPPNHEANRQQHPTDGLQDIVARDVAEGVVVVLEAIDVEDAEPQRASSPGRGDLVVEMDL